MHRDGKPKGFFYLDHRTVDGRHAIITDAHVTPGNVHDSVPYLDRIDSQVERFGFDIKAVGIDAGYITAPTCKGLSDRIIYGAMPYKRPMGKPGMIKKREFLYNEHYDCYLCHEGQVLTYSTTNREGRNEYKSDPALCTQCPRLKECTLSRNHQKVIHRHIWEKHCETINNHRYEERGKRIYKRRKETVDRSFADAKEFHGHRYARFRGIDKVQEQCLMAACAQNIKKIALLLAREGLDRLLMCTFRLIGRICVDLIHLNRSGPRTSGKKRDTLSGILLTPKRRAPPQWWGLSTICGRSTDRPFLCLIILCLERF